MTIRLAGEARIRVPTATLLIVLCLGAPARAQPAASPPRTATDERIARQQVPNWSDADRAFFEHGSLSTEVVPEVVLKAFCATYPALWPATDLAAFGLLTNAGDTLPLGISRREVPHLGGLPSIGINCAACHLTDVAPAAGGPPVRVLGVTSHFDSDAYFGALLAATFQTADPDNMTRFLANYFVACEPQASEAQRAQLAEQLRNQRGAIAAAIAAELADQRAAPPSQLLQLDPATLTLDAHHVQSGDDLPAVTRGVLRLFFNMRAALHVPQQPPTEAPPDAGPGRNNAFGVLSFALFGEPAAYAPAKFGLVWNLHQRTWVHWDGNTRSPLVRNLAASLGLGAPLAGRRGMTDYTLVERHTRLSERIAAPRYPWKIDAPLAERGRPLFVAQCARCHVHKQRDEDQRLYALDEVGTDVTRARLVDAHQADLYNRFFGELELAGYTPAKDPVVRSTQKYVAVDLAGVWARSPYLHNGSVRTMRELLTPATERAKTFHRGSRVYDEVAMGYIDDGAYLLDTTSAGNSNAGHEYGTRDLNADEKQALIEYLKTL